MQLFVGAKALVHYQGKILLLRESQDYTDGAEEGKWDVPGGRIEPDEEVRTGLIREVNEESGLDIVPGKLLGVYDGFPLIRGETCHVVRVYFLCEATTHVVTLSKDHDAYDWVTPNTIGDKILMSDIREVLEEAKKVI